MRAKWRRESPAKNGKRPGAARSSIPRQVKERDQRACVICGSSYGLQVHHVVPISEGGSHDPSNLVTLCAKHHRQAHHG